VVAPGCATAGDAIIVASSGARIEARETRSFTKSLS
jgi:hypothetical protein